jgi:hypothetical protein
MAKKFKVSDLPAVGGASAALGRTDGKLVFDLEFTTESPLPTGNQTELLTLASGYVVTAAYAEVLEGGTTGFLNVYPDGEPTATVTVATQTAGDKQVAATFAKSSVSVEGSVELSAGTVRVTLLVSDVA